MQAVLIATAVALKDLKRRNYRYWWNDAR